MHSDKKPETDDIDDEIVEWILMNRKLGITVTSWEVIVKASTTLNFQHARNFWWSSMLSKKAFF